MLQLGDDEVMGAADRPSQRRRQSANPPPVQEAAILALLKDIDDDTHPGDARHHELCKYHQCTSRAYAKLLQNLIVGGLLLRLLTPRPPPPPRHNKVTCIHAQAWACKRCCLHPAQALTCRWTSSTKSDHRMWSCCMQSLYKSAQKHSCGLGDG